MQKADRFAQVMKVSRSKQGGDQPHSGRRGGAVGARAPSGPLCLRGLPIRSHCSRDRFVNVDIGDLSCKSEGLSCSADIYQAHLRGALT